MWGTLGTHTVFEKSIILERAQSQLGLTASTLADFNELAEQATGDVALRGSESRSAAVWRALLQYPTASIWVEKNGVVSAGQLPASDLAQFLLINDARPGFAVHAALPRVDALADWRRSAGQRGVALCIVSLGFLILARFLVRALQQRVASRMFLRPPEIGPLIGSRLELVNVGATAGHAQGAGPAVNAPVDVQPHDARGRPVRGLRQGNTGP
jgi:hypothetical protein